MVRESKHLSAGTARLRDPVRMELESGAAEAVRTRFTRHFLSVEILRGMFALTPDAILAVQDTGSLAAFDVSFFTATGCLQFLEEFEWRRGASA